MKTTNQFFTLVFTLVLLSNTFPTFAQDAPVMPAYVVATTLHWNMDYENYEYNVINTNTQNRVGTVTPINWYEYVNPS